MVYWRVTQVRKKVPIRLANFRDDEVRLVNGTRVATLYPVSMFGGDDVCQPGTHGSSAVMYGERCLLFAVDVVIKDI